MHILSRFQCYRFFFAHLGFVWSDAVLLTFIRNDEAKKWFNNKVSRGLLFKCIAHEENEWIMIDWHKKTLSASRPILECCWFAWGPSIKYVSTYFFFGGGQKLRKKVMTDKYKKVRDVSTGATGVTQVAPKFWDTLTLAPSQRSQLNFSHGYVPERGRQINIHKRLNTIINNLPLNKYHTSPDLVP